MTDALTSDLALFLWVAADAWRRHDSVTLRGARECVREIREAIEP